METFKNWIQRSKKYITVDTPTHFKLPDIKKYITVDLPVHFKHIDEPVITIEEESQLLRPLDHVVDRNKELYGGRLHNILQTQYKDHVTQTDKNSLRKYTEELDDHTGSLHLNNNLAKGVPVHRLSEKYQNMHRAIMANAVPSQHEFHLFSGVSRDFERLSKQHHSNYFHFPAHTSMTHDAKTAFEFAVTKFHRSRDNPTHKHMMHLYVKPGDHILPVEWLSDNPEEHEVIIPAETKMKYHGTVEQNIPFKRSWENEETLHPFKIHHFTIDR